MTTPKVYIAILMALARLTAADWLTDGGKSQTNRHGSRTRPILNKDNVKNLKILWKLQLDNVPHEMHSLFPPLIVEAVNTPEGIKQIAIEAGIDDNIYAIDVVAGKVLWKKHFEYPDARASAATRAIRCVPPDKPPLR